MPKTEEGLFAVLEEELKKLKGKPVDCHFLFDKPKVREYAPSANRVSDYLGHMWRRGQVTRLPAPKLEGTRSRWLYVWKERPQAPQMVAGVDFSTDKGITVYEKPMMEITDNGGIITIELPKLTIVIKPKT